MKTCIFCDKPISGEPIRQMAGNTTVSLHAGCVPGYNRNQSELAERLELLSEKTEYRASQLQAAAQLARDIANGKPFWEEELRYAMHAFGDLVLGRPEDAERPELPTSQQMMERHFREGRRLACSVLHPVSGLLE